MPFDIGGTIFNGSSADVKDYKNIITRGLVLHLDASALESYPRNGTTWYDISGNNNHGTLTNGPTFSNDNQGYIDFDGSNDYVTIPDSSNWDFGTGEFSIEMWIYLNGAQPANYSGYIGTFQSKWPASGWVIMNSPGTNMRSYSNDGTYETTISTNVTLNAWNHIVLTKVSNTGYMYVNGSSNGTQDWTSRAFNNTGNPLLIGAGSADYSKIRMASVKIYKGVGFTSGMITHNYNTQKGRFGL
jgi:hypothetical protein